MRAGARTRTEESIKRNPEREVQNYIENFAKVGNGGELDPESSG